ncbi:MAG TPA: alpha/beta fold hydrolase [Thermoanaerobaculia bacterium]
MPRKPRLIALILLGGLLAGLGFLLYAGHALAAPQPAVIGPPPPDLHAEAVEIPSASGSRLRGWLCRMPGSRGVVILMHGVRANRLSMVRRARLFRDHGYSVLLFDFQAHGESPGEHITFGHLESRDARAALDFVHRELPGQPVAAVGSSLGGAAAVLADPPLDLDALVLESVYPTIEEATRERLRIRLGPLGPPLAPLLLAQLKPRLGISPSTLRPIDHISQVRCPVFVISGTADQHTTPAQAKALFARAPDPKRLWLVPGAAHVDLDRFAGAEYERRVLEFLADAFHAGKAVLAHPQAPPA